MNIFLFASDFLLQTGMVLAGAAAFWGLYFSFKAHHEPEAAKDWGSLAKVLSPLFALSVVLSTIGWFMSDAQDEVQLIFGIVLLAMAVFIALVHFDAKRLHARLELLNFLALALVFATIVFTDLPILVLAEIFSLGTVIVIGLIYLGLRGSLQARRVFLDSLSFFFAIVWVGLAADTVTGLIQFGPELFYGQSPLIVEGLLGLSIMSLAVLSGFALAIWLNKVKVKAAVSLSIELFISLSSALLFSSLLFIRALRAYEIVLLNTSELLIYYLITVFVVTIAILLVKKIK